MNILSFKKNNITLISGIILLGISTISMADYSPYPGKRTVKLIDVEAPNIVVISFETWPGYGRTLRIKLPDLDVPGNSTKPKPCELELAQKALDFTRKFVSDSDTVIVQDMQMEDSASDQAISTIRTNKGSLGAALKKEGLARPSAIDPETPWCK